MYLFCLLALSVLMNSATWGQAINITGIKVIESGFNPETKTLKLVFINDRADDITAYHYCFKIVSTDPKQTRENCQLLDPLRLVLQMRADKKARPWIGEMTFSGPGENFVHPGEKRIIEEQIGFNDTIYDGSIYIDEVAWSDDTFEGPSKLIIQERMADSKEREFVRETVKHALASGLAPLLITSVITTLQAALQQELHHGTDEDRCNACSEKRMNVLYNALYSLEHPGWYSGRGDEKFIPNDQEEFLNEFLSRHEAFSAEISKHVSLRKREGQ